MPRYIDADALTDKLVALMERYAEQGRTEVAQDYNWVCTVLDAAPTADVAPVIHAHWMKANGGKWRCSSCRGRQEKPSRFCKECGARMNERKGGEGGD